MPDVMIAREGARLVVGGRSVRIIPSTTTAHAGSRVVRDHPHLWVPLPVDFPAEDNQPEAVPAPGAATRRPERRDGRAVWDAYAVAVGFDPDAVAAMATKADVIAAVDEAGPDA